QLVFKYVSPWRNNLALFLNIARINHHASKRRRILMANVESFPYETRLNLLCQPLEVIDERALADACTYKWYNQTLCQVNGSVVRLGVVLGEYHWHKHDDDDEFFYVVEGK